MLAIRKPHARAEVTAGARFLALPVAPCPSDRRTVIEVVGRHGDRMRVEVSGDVEVTGLVHAFWSRTSWMQVTPQMRILVSVEPADLRAGIDGLCRVCRAELFSDPFSGAVFVFRNRRGTASG